MNKIAIVEIGGAHDECLYSQLMFLKDGGYDVDLICSENLKRQVLEFNLPQNIIFIDTSIKRFNKFRIAYKLRSIIKKGQYRKVILNTAQGSVLRTLMFLPALKDVEFIGVMHNLNKLYDSNSQKIISKRVRKYFTLNSYLMPVQKRLKGIKLGIFYPIYFPNYRAIPIDKPKNELWIAIPGQIELKRRDYLTLINTIDKQQLPNHLKFLLIGNCSNSNDCKDVRQLIETKGLLDHFKFWDCFVSNDEFHSYLKQSDYIMPLPKVIDKDSAYLNYKISGSFNLAFAYKKPLLMPDFFSHLDDFKENAVFYNWSDLNQLFVDLYSKGHRLELYQHQKWQYDYQRDNYLKFIKEG